MTELLLSLLARLEDLFVARRPEPLAVPIRRDDWRGPRHGDRRH